MSNISNSPVTDQSSSSDHSANRSKTPPFCLPPTLLLSDFDSKPFVQTSPTSSSPDFAPEMSDIQRVDREKYVRLCQEGAERAKRKKRDELKAMHRSMEMQAENRGKRFTSRERERIRSRRESAVTRTKNLVYVKMLEQYTRMVPELERDVAEMKKRLFMLEQENGSEFIRDLDL